MDFDESLVRRLAGTSPSWAVTVRGRRFVPAGAAIAKSAVPVRRPGVRGGAYFSDTEAYRITCDIDDPSVLPLLTSVMLGPSTEFTPLVVEASAPGSGTVTMRANLTGYVQTGGRVRLNMVVVDAAPS